MLSVLNIPTLNRLLPGMQQAGVLKQANQIEAVSPLLATVDKVDLGKDAQETRRSLQLIEEADRYVSKAEAEGGDVKHARGYLDSARRLADTDDGETMAVIKARMALLLARTETVRIETGRKSDDLRNRYADPRNRVAQDGRAMLERARVTLESLQSATDHLKSL